MRRSEAAHHRRSMRARERQLQFQKEKARKFRGHEQERIEILTNRSAGVFELLSTVADLPERPQVLEVGSGSEGLAHYFPSAGLRVGIDPLAVPYRSLFPAWYGRTAICSALGEALPFGDGAFDIVLSDNVIDHAENPSGIVAELARVLKPGGVLYLTVNTHHPVYGWASSLHGLWNAAGLRLEITPFADHTVHLTTAGLREMLRSTPLRVMFEKDGLEAASTAARSQPPRHPGDLLKRVFFKNAKHLIIASK